MAERPESRSALAWASPIVERDIGLVERPHVAKVDVRGAALDPAFTGAVGSALGTSLPVQPNTVISGAGVRALWLGPDEWLVVSESEPGASLMATLRNATEGQHVAVTDVSHGRCVIRLRGPHARDVLSMGCSLDLHPRAFGAGRCAQTLLAKAAVILHQTSDEPDFDIYVARSFADYLWSWLEDAVSQASGSAAKGARRR